MGKLFTNCFISGIITYGIMAFYTMSLNASTWTENQRFAVILAFVGLTCMLLVIEYLTPTETVEEAALRRAKMIKAAEIVEYQAKKR